MLGTFDDKTLFGSNKSENKSSGDRKIISSFNQDRLPNNVYENISMKILKKNPLEFFQNLQKNQDETQFGFIPLKKRHIESITSLRIEDNIQKIPVEELVLIPDCAWIRILDQTIDVEDHSFLQYIFDHLESHLIIRTKKINILMCKKKENILGIEIFDSNLATDISKKSRNLKIYWQDKQLEYETFTDIEDVKNYLKIKRNKEIILESKIFDAEFVVPIPIMNMMGLSFYEFDHSEICPENLVVLCGVPSKIDDQDLLQIINDLSLPSPISILRNPSFDQTSVRLYLKTSMEAEKYFMKKCLVFELNDVKRTILSIRVKDRLTNYHDLLIDHQAVISFNDPKAFENVLKNQNKFLDEINAIDVSRISEYTFNLTFASARDANLFVLATIKFGYSSYHHEKFVEFSGEKNFQQIQEHKNWKTSQKLVPVSSKKFLLESSLFELKPQLKKRYEKLFVQKYNEYCNIQDANPILIVPKPVDSIQKEEEIEKKRKSKNIKIQVIKDTTENLHMIGDVPIQIKLERVIERETFEPKKKKPKIEDILKSRFKTEKFFVKKNIEKIISLAKVHKSRRFVTEMKKYDKTSFLVKQEPHNGEHFMEMPCGVLINLQDML